MEGQEVKRYGAPGKGGIDLALQLAAHRQRAQNPRAQPEVGIGRHGQCALQLGVPAGVECSAMPRVRRPGAYGAEAVPSSRTGSQRLVCERDRLGRRRT